MKPLRDPIPRTWGILSGLVVVPFMALPLVQWRRTSVVAWTWVPVPAVVLSRELEVWDGEEGRTYVPRIRYAYEVGGRRHESRQFDVMGREGSRMRGESQAFLDRFQVGQKVTAYHDPEDPARAVLFREVGAQGYLLVFGIAWILLDRLMRSRAC